MCSFTARPRWASNSYYLVLGPKALSGFCTAATNCWGYQQLNSVSCSEIISTISLKKYSQLQKFKCLNYFDGNKFQWAMLNLWYSNTLAQRSSLHLLGTGRHVKSGNWKAKSMKFPKNQTTPPSAYNQVMKSRPELNHFNRHCQMEMQLIKVKLFLDSFEATISTHDF